MGAERPGNQLICRFSEKDKTAYCYDKQGNRLEAAGSEGTEVFSYNAFHQQTAVTMLDGKHLENRYDAEYLRAGAVENGTVTTFSLEWFYESRSKFYYRESGSK